MIQEFNTSYIIDDSETTFYKIGEISIKNLPIIFNISINGYTIKRSFKQNFTIHLSNSELKFTYNDYQSNSLDGNSEPVLYLKKDDSYIHLYVIGGLISIKSNLYGLSTYIKFNMPDYTDKEEVSALIPPTSDIINIGTFEQKPSNSSLGFAYFCTDKQTIEGSRNGIMIYYAGDNTWVDALGRVVS